MGEVISIVERRKKQIAEDWSQEILEKNKKNKERIRRERTKRNKEISKERMS